MIAILMLLYGMAVYCFSLLTFLCVIGFVANDPHLPTTIDAGASMPWPQAVLVNLLLLGLFAIQHSAMARPAFKRWWTQFVPGPIERSTYVAFASGALALLVLLWQPIKAPMVWDVTSSGGKFALWTVFGTGWGMALVTTFLLNHFELFGLHQVLANLRGSSLPAPEFRTPLFYRYVRHPLYVGLLLGFWATPQMTSGHLLFALANSGYILIGIWFEERELVAQFGERYRRYREQVGMLMPRGSRAPRQRPIDN